jgi:hypothetical protein
MEQSAAVPRLAHIRMIGLLSVLWVLDSLLLIYAVESILLEGPTVMIMFASEVRRLEGIVGAGSKLTFASFRLQYMILLANVWTTTMKYAINCIDLRSEVPWEDKSIYGLYVELAAGPSFVRSFSFRQLTRRTAAQTFSSSSPTSASSPSSSPSTASPSISSATSTSPSARS